MKESKTSMKTFQIFWGIFQTILFTGVSITWLFNVPLKVIVFDEITDRIIGLMFGILAVHEGMKTHHLMYEEADDAK